MALPPLFSLKKSCEPPANPRNNQKPHILHEIGWIPMSSLVHCGIAVVSCACLPALGSLCYCRLGRWQMSDSVGSRVSFFVVGLGIGAIIGILFAPKSGEETRDYLSAKADEGRDYAQQKARELRERAEDLLERSKEIMARQKDAVSSAVEAGKETYKREANLS